jgi:glucokinase
VGDRERGALIGVDIGGTKVASGIVDEGGSILAQSRVAMVADRDANAGFAAVCSAIDAMLARAGELKLGIDGIGICSPGPLNPDTGVVINPPNLPCWRNFPLASKVSERYVLPVKVGNDANAAALAETIWGAGTGYRHVFYTCIGTGIGTGIIFDNEIYYGHTGAAGEGGHVSIDYRGPRCNCGKPGCIEVLASGTAIANRARARLEEQPGQSAILLQLVKGIPANLTCNMVAEALAAGDALAREITAETVQFLSLWLGNIVDLLDPDVVIIGGGVANMLRPWFGDLKNGLVVSSINSRANEIPIVPSRYGDEAGIAGGAALLAGRGANRRQELHV